MGSLNCTGMGIFDKSLPTADLMTLYGEIKVVHHNNAIISTSRGQNIPSLGQQVVCRVLETDTPPMWLWWHISRNNLENIYRMS